MDDDATTICKLRKEHNPNLEKWSDVNHAKKTLTSSLYLLAKKHTILSSRKNKIINYIRKGYSYAIVQNKGNAELLASNMRAIVPHMFGDHENCGEWCKGRQDETYKCAAFRGCRVSPESLMDLKNDLVNVLETHARTSERLAPNGSTKTNESFNNVVSSKCSKNKHYSSSESFQFRVSAAAAQKNFGRSYVAKVMESKSSCPNRISMRKGLVQDNEIRVKK